jgi:hypothetical protein
MKEYGEYKDVDELTEEDRLVIGARLLDFKREMTAVLSRLKEETKISPLNVYDVRFWPADGSDFGVWGACHALTAADSEVYTCAMRNAALNRSMRFRQLAIELLGERICEINNVISAL